jgi:hypothetical protein
MRGIYHLISGFVFLFVLLIFDLILNLGLVSFFLNSSFLIFFVSIYLFFAGILLPDADKFNSWSFKFFFPLALISWVVGFFASSIQGKRFRHRGFLHSFLGAFLTSFSSSFLFFLFLRIFINLDLFFLPLFFFSVFLGQIIHLAFD